MRYELSTTDALTLPEAVLHDLDERLGGVVLVGSWARDVCLVLGAGLPLGRATDDLDIAVATPSWSDLDRRLGDLGPRRGHGVRITCSGLPVDILPFGGVQTGPVVEPAEDSSLDVTALAETYEHADELVLANGHVVRTACLPAMLALKLVAWDVRSPGTDKDAEDLDRMLQATYEGPHLDSCYADDGAERWDFDVELIGPFRAGRALADVLHPDSRQRVLGILRGDRRDRLLAVMPGRGADRGAQLQALAAGLDRA